MVSWRVFSVLVGVGTPIMLLLPPVAPFLSHPSPKKAIAQENSHNLGQRLAFSYLRKIPVTSIPDNLTLEQAEKIQAEFVRYLLPTLGKVVGYKAGLTNEMAQKRFQVSEPVRGVLLSKMLLNNGVTIPANFGTYPMKENV